MKARRQPETTARKEAVLRTGEPRVRTLEHSASRQRDWETLRLRGRSMSLRPEPFRCTLVSARVLTPRPGLYPGSLEGRGQALRGRPPNTPLIILKRGFGADVRQKKAAPTFFSSLRLQEPGGAVENGCPEALARSMR